MKQLQFVSVLIAVLLLGAGCSLFGSKGQSSTDGGIFQSGDYGTSWQSASFIGVLNKREVTLKNENAAQLVFHPTDTNTIYFVTGSGSLYRTANAGGQWTKVNQTIAGIQHLAVDPKVPETLYVSQSGNILKSLDSGLNWETVYIESVAAQQVTGLLIDPTNPAQVYAATNTGAVIVSTDSGKTWARRSTLDVSIKKILFSPNNSTIIFALTENRGVWRSSDAGVKWEDISVPVKAIDRKALNINDIAIKKTDPATILLGTAYGLIVTHNGGTTWETLPTVIENNTVPIQTVALDPDAKPIVYFSVENKIHRSIDNGAHWSVAQLPTARQINQLIIDEANSAVLYAGVMPKPKK